MTETNGNGRGKVNVGDFLHVLEIAVLLVSIGVTYEKFNETTQAVQEHTQQLSRIEHYLSSKDPNYWHLSREGQ